MPSGLRVESRRDGTTGVVRVVGEARLELAEALSKEGKSLLDAGVRHLLVDVTDLMFADSASLGVLLDVQRTAESRGGGLAVFGARDRLKRALDGTGLSARLRSSTDEASARKALGL